MAFLWVTSCGEADAGVDAAFIPERTHTYEVPPGDFIELRLLMADSAAATIDYTATATLVWEVHVHDNLSVIVLSEGQGSSGGVPFTAPRDGTYGWQWSNYGDAPISLTVMLEFTGPVELLEW